jgi:hypothetical protein
MTDKPKPSASSKEYLIDNYVPTTGQNNYTPNTGIEGNYQPTSEGSPKTQPPAPKKK